MVLGQLYDDLRRLAAQMMAHEKPGQTLQATALVHEAWLRISGRREGPWQNRAHFFAAAAEAMRRILIDNARRKQAVRHGGELHRTELDDHPVAAGAPAEELLALDEALGALAAHDARKAELVKHRDCARILPGLCYFVGRSNRISICDLSDPGVSASFGSFLVPAPFRFPAWHGGSMV